MRYERSPVSLFEDSMLILCFLAAVEMNPRTLCACHWVACTISARVAPLARPISARICSVLLPLRVLADSFGDFFAPAFSAFLGLLVFCGDALVWVLAFLVPLLAGFFELAVFFAL